MKKIFNFLMVICLAVAAFTMTFAICLPGAKTSGANISATSANAQSVNLDTSAQSVVPAMSATNYSEETSERGATLVDTPTLISQFSQSTFRERTDSLPDYKLRIKRSFFDSPLFVNSKSLKQPPIFSQPQARSSPIRR